MEEDKDSYRGTTIEVERSESADLAERLRELAIELIDRGVSTPEDVTSITGVVYAYKEIAMMAETTTSTDVRQMSKKLLELEERYLFGN
jgi:C4-type Zn-finger protein